MAGVGIDTNVFQHLFNPAMNTNAHIDRLLSALILEASGLLVDSTSKIANEYQQLLVPIIKNNDETRPQLPLLRHWMSPDIRHVVKLDPRDNLMQQIKAVIREPAEHADRAFVYVACCGDTLLITNDDMHILRRRAALLKKTRRLRGPDTDIQSSCEAAARFRME